ELDVLLEIEKRFGKGSIFQLGVKSSEPVDVISTGIIGLDTALGIGGFPRGKIVELYSESGCGKSGICLQVIANAQKQGLKCAIVDTEHALDLTVANLLGVDVNELYVSQPESGNVALEICEMLVKSGQFGVVIVDSVAGLTPEEEISGEYGDSNIGRMAKLMNQAMRKMIASVNSTNTCLIFTNQIRDNIGAFGHAETFITVGGRALKYFSSVRVQLNRVQQVKDGDVVVGHRVKCKVVKNRLAPPFRESNHEITYGQNAVRFNELVELGVEHKIIDKSGSWMSVNGERFQGKEKLKAYLVQNPQVADEIEGKIRTELGVA
ncbi:MAG TPA: recombinase RecA, partial [Leptospiraceae bacterium]|nr:recombinase RecA [Leptospiraceae bacterium]